MTEPPPPPIDSPAPVRPPDPADRAVVEISVVVPVYNEVQNVGALHESLSYAMRSMHRRYELVFVDDGSDDGTRRVLRDIAAGDPQVRVLLFRRNCGQTQAMAAGFDAARGAVVVTMDGDLQNDPSDIPRLVEELERGFDIVCGWRRHRHDAYLTRLLPSMAANQLIRWTTGVPIHDTGCSLKAYRAWVVRSLTLYSDMHRFIAALGAGLGARISEVTVRHHSRRFGSSKYGLSRIFRVVIDLVVIKMLIQFAAHPIRWFGILSLPVFVASLILVCAEGFNYAFDGTPGAVGTPTEPIRLSAMFMAGVAVTLTIAFNVFFLGFLAELQLKASRFFRKRISITAVEASH